jgi:SSS family solute:Na+ symporter
MQAFLIAYGIALIYIAFRSSRNHDSFASYVVAGRNQPRLLIIASMLASTIGGGLTLGTVSKAYTLGFPAFWFVASGAAAHFIQALFLSEKVRKTEALTLPDLAEHLSNTSVRKLTAVIIVLTWTGIAAGQFLAASKIIGAITGYPHQWAVIVCASFLVLYTIIGGQKSILRTDFFQFGLLAASLLLAIGWLFGFKPVSFAALDIHLFSTKFGPIDLMYYLIVVAGSYLICPMMFGRILSSATPRDARNASLTSAAGMLFFAFAITFLGLWARASGFSPGAKDPLNAMIAQVFPGWLGFLLTFGILAAILSTADSVLLTAASVFEHDVLGGNSKLRTQGWVGLAGFVGAIIALYNTDIVDLLLKTYQGYTSGIVPALFVATVVSGKKKVDSRFLFAGILVGYGLGLGGNLLPSPDGQKLMAFAGIFASLGISLLGLRKVSLN